MQKKIILYCVLNWGLGHATRSIAIISELQNQGHQVIICSDGISKIYLDKEFPELKSEELPGYNVHYNGPNMALSLLSQTRKITKARLGEKKKINHLVEELKPDIIISDNRYGCYHHSTKNIFIGHQWNLINSLFRAMKFISWIQQRQIKLHFDQVWIPDDPQYNISGKLSQNKLSHPYTGILSRFVPSQLQNETDIDYLFIISGPEPYRSTLESKALQISHDSPDKKCVIVRGKATEDLKTSQLNTEIIDLASSAILNDLIKSSQLIISRSGYSSLMDYVTIGYRKLLLVPTPKQPEQLYLAWKFSKTGKGILNCAEKDLDLEKIEQAYLQKPNESRPYVNGLLTELIATNI